MLHFCQQKFDQPRFKVWDMNLNHSSLYHWHVTGYSKTTIRQITKPAEPYTGIACGDDNC
ncbi:hypothetical protein BH10PLA2_BH10PLA2_19450 [soil metagenome]